MYQTSGGFTGETKDIATGTRQLEFTADSMARIYENKVLVDTRQYSVRRSTSLLSGEPSDILYYLTPGGRFIPQRMTVDAKTLTLIDEMNDGFTYSYRRL
jgi:hypothetical protein